MIDRGDRFVDVIEGWFKAPATAHYKFMMSCDDHCMLEVHHKHMTKLDEPVKLHSNIAVTYREFFRNDGVQRETDFLNMTEGEYYYIKGTLAEWGWGDHMTVGVQIKYNNTIHNLPSNHTHIRKEVQHINISAGN